ncbi:MAG: phosphopentomutase [Clostridia bacterium]|nr:phosphopentomutase [Clostridia bacterium]
MKKRIFLVVLDSLGVGALPDAAEFSDEGSHTLKSIFASPLFSAENLIEMGLGNIEGQEFLPQVKKPLASYGKMKEASRGKDTTIGHWEIAGIVSPLPLPTYPRGFPEEILSELEKKCGRKILCNKPFSGTKVIECYGKEHLETGALIVYTSADSVFQIAAHEEKIPVEELYRICEAARGILQGKHGVGRVIARPFVGEPGSFTRTANRHDFSLEPPEKTLLDAAKEEGFDVISIGKIVDIFASRGITEAVRTKGNADGIAQLSEMMDREFQGICFLNLVDFDSLYGHRNDTDGYATALGEFDRALPLLLEKIRETDLLIITADHGCDPGTASTDHSREYVPLLVYKKGKEGKALGTRESFTDIAQSCAEFLGLSHNFHGKSFLGEEI